MKKSKSKKKSFIISWEIFPYDVLVCLGLERKEVLAKLDKYVTLSDKENRGLTMEGRGRFVMLSGGQSVLWLRNYPEKGSGVLAHEIFHAVYFLLDKVGIKISDDSDELVSYMIEYLTNQINKRI